MRCVGITWASYYQIVAAHKMAGTPCQGLWPSPMELEKQFN